VKSILADYRRSETAVLTILEALNFDFWKNYTLNNAKNSQKFKIQWSKRQFFGLQNDQTWFTLKSECYKILTFPHSELLIGLPRSVDSFQFANLQMEVL